MCGQCMDDRGNAMVKDAGVNSRYVVVVVSIH